MLEFMRIGSICLELLLLGLLELHIMMVYSSLMFVFLLNTRDVHRYVATSYPPSLIYCHYYHQCSLLTKIYLYAQKVHYHSGGLRLNPNLYESGKVCLSLLNTWWGIGCERWGKSKSTMLQVLISIQGLVLNDKPYFNEPGNKSAANTPVGEKHSVAYNQTAFVLSCKTMLYSLRKPPKVITELSYRSSP